MSLSKIVITGTVEAEPEKRFTNTNNVAVTNFVLSAPQRAGGANSQNNGPISIRVVCWRGLAEAAEQLQRGQEVLVEGKLITNSYQSSSEGVQKKVYEIEASHIERLAGPSEVLAPVGGAEGFQGGGNRSAGGGGNRGGGYATAPAPTNTATAAPPKQDDDFMAEDFLTEDDIPF